MKSLFFVALSVVALMPTIAGTAVPNNAPAATNVTAMALMKAQAASSDAILSRPL